MLCPHRGVTMAQNLGNIGNSNIFDLEMLPHPRCLARSIYRV
jgi:hypothetical protein